MTDGASKVMEKVTSQAGSVTLQGGTLGIVIAIGGMFYSNFDDLDDAITAQSAAQTETNTQVAVLAGKMDVLTTAIGTVQKLRAEFEKQKAEAEQRIIVLEQRIVELESKHAGRRRHQ